MLVYAATTNRGKLDELRAIFAEAGWRIEDSPSYADVAEGTRSYADNAALKARSLYATLVADGVPAAVIGDDSGLEVAALAGRPGVLSARYGGQDASWLERRRAILSEIAAGGSTDRRARFVCALHFIAADGREFAVDDELAGSVAEIERGNGGFSYDAIFVPDGTRETFAELTDVDKNRMSHRGRAARKLVKAVDSSVGKDAGSGM